MQSCFHFHLNTFFIFKKGTFAIKQEGAQQQKMTDNTFFENETSFKHRVIQ